jgi:hypothetical protein
VRGDRSSDGRSHNDALVGWIVWSTTASSSADSASTVELVTESSAERQGSFGRFLCDQRMLAFEP